MDDSSQLINLTLQNYKKFSNMEFPLRKKSLLIMGPNSSGKTQLIYALILYFRGYNLSFPSSNFHSKLPNDDKDVKYLDLKSEAHLLLHPCFNNPKSSYAHFIHDSSI